MPKFKKYFNEENSYKNKKANDWESGELIPLDFKYIHKTFADGQEFMGQGIKPGDTSWKIIYFKKSSSPFHSKFIDDKGKEVDPYFYKYGKLTL